MMGYWIVFLVGYILGVINEYAQNKKNKKDKQCQ